MKLKVIEPLRKIFKDEVRKIGHWGLKNFTTSSISRSWVSR